MKRRRFIQTLGAVCLPSFEPGLLTGKWLTAAGRGFKTSIEDNPGGGYYGVINRQGEIVIPPRFKHWFGFSEGLADIIANVNSGYDGKHGYIDMTGEWAIPPIFDLTGDFQEGLAPVKIGDQWGYINQVGNVVIEPVYSNAHWFKDGLAPVEKNDQVGYINLAGEVVIKMKRGHYGRSFHDGLAGVQKDDKWGFIDQTGKWAIKRTYRKIDRYLDGVCPVKAWG